MNNLGTREELQAALKAGRWTLRKDSLFYLFRIGSKDQLFKPTAVLRGGTEVGVVKLYRGGQAALLRYVDRAGREWWSWTHAK
jgi:hypothetical protein